MPGFSKAYAVLATRFGSLDTRLPDGRELPIGLAHFLEHKMFETPQGDVFDLYAKRGASANAYTTFGYTAYLFSCTSRFEENLGTLLDTLHVMHAEPAGIEREKGIIGQEIAMYDDDAGWRGYFNLLSALYRDHPLRFDIAGTKETIAPIDQAVLRATHAAYYHPANLSLFVAGDVDPAAVLSRATERLVPSAPGAAHRRAPVAEPAEPAAPERRQSLSVSRPQVLLGIKDAAPGTSGRDLLVRETVTEALLDVLFGDGGTVEAPLHAEGLVDDSFQASYQAEPDCAFVSVSAEVDEEAPYRARLLDAIEAARRAGIRPEDVERSRRKAVGSYLRAFNSPERVASLYLALHMKDAAVSDLPAALEAVTPRAVAERLDDLLSRARAWSVIVPREGGGAAAAPPADAEGDDDAGPA
jgi:predicted Zn-dependent peptidase